ncbi:hypothetical protein GRF59_14770 [Paenibacillus sp. HJL G12]|uniref:Uncharacterized protein n=1 Tax=Paenibacillus dendrobii TaxID=2691084 RepID=A0A7X3IMP2_9BACL|nr:hypothetical protein [Paenibacillus dendrobii]MWV44882.1 hypothetical protein [Paenibacillus dendrobii]
MQILSPYPQRGDLIALEDLQQFSIVIKDGEGVRYLNSTDDLFSSDTYFVNQVFPIDTNETIIKKGKYVRLNKVGMVFV